MVPSQMLPCFVEHQIERADRRAGLRDGQRVFDDLAGLRIEHPEDVRSEIGVPDHAVGIGGRIMRQRLGPRQIVFGDDDARRVARRPRQGLQRIPPVGRGAEIDRGEVFGGR